MLLREQVNELMEKSMIADQLKEFKASPEFAVLKSLILDPLQMSAFETFKKTPCGELDNLHIIECQMMSKMVDQIYRTIEAKIQVGDNAKETLLMETTED